MWPSGARSTLLVSSSGQSVQARTIWKGWAATTLLREPTELRDPLWASVCSALPSSQGCGEGCVGGGIAEMVWEQKGVTTPRPLPHSCHEDWSAGSESSGRSQASLIDARGSTTAQPLTGRRAHFLISRLSHLDAIQHASVSFSPNPPCMIQNASHSPHSTDKQTELR